jgi:hypothetical protein
MSIHAKNTRQPLPPTAELQEVLNVLSHTSDYERVLLFLQPYCSVHQLSSSSQQMKKLVSSANRPEEKTDRLLLPTKLESLQMYAYLQCEQFDNVIQWGEKMSPNWNSIHREDDEKNGPNLGLQQQKHGLYQIQSFIFAYAHYQMKNYSKVIHLYKQQQQQQQQLAPGTTNGSTDSSKIAIAWEHLYAQSLHHTQDGVSVLQIYDAILLQEQQEKENVSNIRIYTWTNLLAVLMAYFTVPYCPSVEKDNFVDDDDDNHGATSNTTTTNAPTTTMTNHNVVQLVQRFHATTMQKIMKHITSMESTTGVDFPYELGYNLASYQLYSSTKVRNREIWYRLLDRSILACRNSFSSDSDEPNSQHPYVKEIVPLQLNRAIFELYFWNISSTYPNYNNSTALSIVNNIQYYINDNMNGTKLFVQDNDDAILSALSLPTQWAHRINHTMFMNNTNTIQSNQTMLELLNHIVSIHDQNQYHVLTIVQQHIVFYNLALFYFYDHQYIPCQHICQHYFLSASSKSNKKMKKVSVSTNHSTTSNGGTVVKRPAQYSSVNERLFWECRATVLIANCTVASVMADTAIKSNDDSTMKDNDNSQILEQNSLMTTAAEMLDRYCNVSNCNTSNNAEMMKSYDMTSLSSSICDHVQMYARLHQTAILAKRQPSVLHTVHELQLLMLQSLPKSLQSQPAVVSAITTEEQQLMNNQNETTRGIPSDDTDDHSPTISKLRDLVQSITLHEIDNSIKESDIQNCIVYGDYAMSQKRYSDAVTLYEKVVSSVAPSNSANSNSVDDYDQQYITARYVRALSYVQPLDAVQVWSTVSVPNLMHDVSNSFSGSELEMKEIPFHTYHQSNSTKDISLSNLVSSREMSKKKKSHEAVLRQRAKKRERFIQTLQQKQVGITTTSSSVVSIALPIPDPERWIPKYERSNQAKWRRRRQGQLLSATQGGISANDAAKLDVVARQAARAAEALTNDASSTLRSTAHMNVSGGGSGKSKKRR